MPEVSAGRLRPITSTQNSQVKLLRKAFSQGQDVEGLCAIEGIRLIEEAIRSRMKLRTLFVRESSQNKAERLLEQLSRHAEALLLPDSIFDSAVLTDHPQGVAALAPIREFTLSAALERTPALLVVAAGIQDPGNLGTLVRSAEAFGASAVTATEGTVHPWNPKVLRASAGSSFRLPVLKASSGELMTELRERKIRAMGLVAPRADSPPEAADGSLHFPSALHNADLTQPCALVIGNEGAGIPRELLREIDQFITIPQTHVESLNAGIAGSIALYEAQRQRSAKS